MLGSRGDVAADDDLLRDLLPGLRRFAAAWTPLRVDPDDLVQEAVAATLRTRSLTSLEHPAAYLRAAISNLARNHHRTDRRWVALGPEAVDAAGPVAVDRYPSDLSLLEAVPPEERALVLLVDIEHLTYAEAAEALDLSVPTVKGRLAAARRTLREAAAGSVTDAGTPPTSTKGTP